MGAGSAGSGRVSAHRSLQPEPGRQGGRGAGLLRGELLPQAGAGPVQGDFGITHGQGCRLEEPAPPGWSQAGPRGAASPPLPPALRPHRLLVQPPGKCSRLSTRSPAPDADSAPSSVSAVCFLLQDADQKRAGESGEMMERRERRRRVHSPRTYCACADTRLRPRVSDPNPRLPDPFEGVARCSS